MCYKKKKKKKTKNNGVYCPSLKKKEKNKLGLTPLEFSELCDKIKLGINKVEIFNYYY